MQVSAFLHYMYLNGIHSKQKNITHVVYSLTLMSDPRVYGNIVRDPVVQIEYKCIYPYIRKLSLAFPIISFSR